MSSFACSVVWLVGWVFGCVGLLSRLKAASFDQLGQFVVPVGFLLKYLGGAWK